jgi:hypothetical protein
MRPSGELLRSALGPLPDLHHEIAGGNAFALQRPEALCDDGHGDHRANQYWHHQPAAGLDEFKQESITSERIATAQTVSVRAATRYVPVS